MSFSSHPANPALYSRLLSLDYPALNSTLRSRPADHAVHSRQSEHHARPTHPAEESGVAARHHVVPQRRGVPVRPSAVGVRCRGRGPGREKDTRLSATLLEGPTETESTQVRIFQRKMRAVIDRQWHSAKYWSCTTAIRHHVRNEE